MSAPTRVPAYVVRPFRWWDIEAVLPVERALFEDAWSAELFWSELAQGQTRTYVVAAAGDEVIGYAGLAAYPDEAYVQTLAVAPGWQRQQVATRLLLLLVRDTLVRGLDRIGLEVRVDNLAAQGLYRRFGFAPVGLRRGYYQPSGADALVMLATDIDDPAYAARLDRIEHTLPAVPVAG